MPVQKPKANQNQVIDGTVDDYDPVAASATATDFNT